MSKIVIDRAVVEQALDALQDADTLMEHRQDVELRHSAMAALRAALEQPQVEQRPVAYEFYNPVTGHAIVDYSEHTHVGHLTADKGYITTALYAHMQPQHGQIALNHSIEIECQKCGSTEKGILAFTLHPQPPRQQPQVEQEPFAVLVRKNSWHYDAWEVGPRGNLDYGRAWADERINVYIHPQNLNCKSTQHRLATLWGYEKPQPPRQPLTDEQILNFGPGQPDAVWTYEDQLYFARAIERAHGIGGEA